MSAFAGTRHRLANACYAVGKALDIAVPGDAYGDGLTFGDRDDTYDRPRNETHASLQFHVNDAPVRASYTAGRFTYAALTIGRGANVTLFLSRRTTRKMLTVLGELERCFAKYGEGDR